METACIIEVAHVHQTPIALRIIQLLFIILSWSGSGIAEGGGRFRALRVTDGQRVMGVSEKCVEGFGLLVIFAPPPQQ